MSQPYSCWDGWELRGRVRDVILRGKVRGEKLVGSRTEGRFVPRTLRPEVIRAAPDFDFTFASEHGRTDVPA